MTIPKNSLMLGIHDGVRERSVRPQAGDRIPPMRFVAFCVGAIFTGCAPTPAQGRTVWVTLDLHERTIASTSGPSTRENQWPYRTIATQGSGKAGEWPTGMAFDRDPGEPRDVQIRCFDAPNHAVRVEVTFTGTPNEHLGSITFLHLSRVDHVFEVLGGSSRPYDGGSQDGDKFVLRAPPAPATITFVGGHTH